MKSDTITSTATLPAVDLAPWIAARPLPSEHDVDGEIVVLGPRAEHASPSVARLRTLFVVTGELTVTVGRTNHILATDAVLTIPPDRAVTLRNHSAAPAKVLSLILPEARVRRSPPPDLDSVGARS